MTISVKLQDLVQQETDHASGPSINPLLKIDAVLDDATGKMI